jgi:hypothetical protein
VSLCSFAFGYAVYFGVELGQMKWWLSRFLVPGTAMSLTCLGFAALAGLAAFGRVKRGALWALLLIAAAFGPLTELFAIAYRTYVIAAQADPISQRLNLLTRTKGPFIFEGLLFRPESATQDARGFFIVGGEGRGPGMAVYSRAMPMRAGKYGVGVRIDLNGPAAPEAPLLEFGIAVDGTNEVVATRAIRSSDLQRAPDGYWAWLDFELPLAKDVRFRLWNASGSTFVVTDVRLRRP